MESNWDRYAFIALGSNEGDPEKTVRVAMDRLQRIASTPILRSSLWRTEPIDCPPGSSFFVNAAIGLEPEPKETPESFLCKLQSIEREFGRRPKKVPNEPRPLDLDLIAFQNETRDTETLQLPHPRAHIRRFVLTPLSEIAPTFILPGQVESVSEVVAKLPKDSEMQLLNRD